MNNEAFSVGGPPRSVDDFVEKLEAENARLRARVEALETERADLRRQLLEWDSAAEQVAILNDIRAALTEGAEQ